MKTIKNTTVFEKAQQLSNDDQAVWKLICAEFYEGNFDYELSYLEALDHIEYSEEEIIFHDVGCNGKDNSFKLVKEPHKFDITPEEKEDLEKFYAEQNSELQEKVEEILECWQQEFDCVFNPDNQDDSLWLETSYTDLSKEQQETTSYQEFENLFIAKQKEIYFEDFLENGDLGDIFDEGENEYCKLGSKNEDGEPTIKVWKLSPNGLTKESYSPFHQEFYCDLVNPAFENDSEKAELLDEV